MGFDIAGRINQAGAKKGLAHAIWIPASGSRDA